MFDIEKGIAFAGRKSGKGVKKYPFDTMQVGDSFLIKDASLHASARVQASKNSTGGRVFKCAKEGLDLRVFRLDDEA